MKKSGRCSCGSGCCESVQENKKIIIDFLYLDLSVCERCQGTEKNLEEAIDEVSGILKAAGYDLIVNKVNITSKDLAIKFKFLSSPTIRVNGVDIDINIKETTCTECGDLCGDTVDCRVWVYEGIEYNIPPKSLIINAILKSVYSENKNSYSNNNEYKLPSNLQLFFNGIEKRD